MRSNAPRDRFATLGTVLVCVPLGVAACVVGTGGIPPHFESASTWMLSCGTGLFCIPLLMYIRVLISGPANATSARTVDPMVEMTLEAEL